MALLIKCYFIYIYKKDQSKILKINWKIMDNIRGRLRHIKVEFIASTIYIPREHVEERFQTKDSGRRENKTWEIRVHISCRKHKQTENMPLLRKHKIINGWNKMRKYMRERSRTGNFMNEWKENETKDTSLVLLEYFACCFFHEHTKKKWHAIVW